MATNAAHRRGAGAESSSTIRLPRACPSPPTDADPPRLKPTMPPSGPTRRPPITAAVRRQLTADARAFLCERYGLDEAQAEMLAAVPVVWARGRDGHRGLFVGGPGHGVGRSHVYLSIPRGETARRVLYSRRTAGLTTPSGGLEMPIRLALTLTLVHEHTHALQYGAVEGFAVRRGEVEPTKNEIRYLSVHAPELHARLVPVPPRSRRPARSPRAAEPASRIPRRVGWPLRDLVAWFGRRLAG